MMAGRGFIGQWPPPLSPPDGAPAVRGSRNSLMSTREPPRPPAHLLDSIAAARARDEQALEEVIRHYQDRVAGYVNSRLGRNGADVDDLCQVVCLKMALAMPKPRSDDGCDALLFN